MVLSCITSWACCKSVNSAGFFVLFSYAGHKSGSIINFARLFTISIIRPFASRLLSCASITISYFCFRSFSRFLAARVVYLTRCIVCSKTQHLSFIDTCVVVYTSITLYSAIFFQDCVQSIYLVFVASVRCCKVYDIYTSVSFPKDFCCIL